MMYHRVQRSSGLKAGSARIGHFQYNKLVPVFLLPRLLLSKLIIFLLLRQNYAIRIGWTPLTPKKWTTVLERMNLVLPVSESPEL